MFPPKLSSHRGFNRSVPARGSWSSLPPPPPPPSPLGKRPPARTKTKEELRREVEVHRVVESQLSGACKVAQVRSPCCGGRQARWGTAMKIVILGFF
jgi:hypothetical protein